MKRWFTRLAGLLLLSAVLPLAARNPQPVRRGGRIPPAGTVLHRVYRDRIVEVKIHRWFRV